MNHLERMPEVRASLLLHLDDQHRPAAPQHEVELVAARPRVGLEQSVPAESIVKEGAALAAVHAAAASSGSW